jgi:transposase
VANVRNDWQWKQARLLVTAFDLLVFESLNIKAMHQLWGRKVGDLGFAEFLLKTRWMATKLGKELVQINRWEPTSQMCHLCQHRQQMPLNMRIFVCGGCGHVEDRDLNAAHNILEAGRSLRSGATRKTSHQVNNWTIASSCLPRLRLTISPLRQTSLTVPPNSLVHSRFGSSNHSILIGCCFIIESLSFDLLLSFPNEYD